MTSVVYFIQSVEGPVKIGWSNNLKQRQINLATASGIGTVLASIAGGEELEAHFHEMLAEHRLHGEWFSPHEAVLNLAQAIRLGSFVPAAGFDAQHTHKRRVKFSLAEAIQATKNEASDLVKQIAGPMRLGERTEHAWRKVEAMTGIPRKRVKTLWYHEAHTINAAELDRLREVAKEANGDARVSSNVEDRLARLEAALSLSLDGQDANSPRVVHRPMARG